jgi:hypothetical protein
MKKLNEKEATENRWRAEFVSGPLFQGLEVAAPEQ